MTKDGHPKGQRGTRGVTLWFTGLPCSGKSTIAQIAGEELRRRGHRVELLDGDEVRQHLTKGLGFSKEGRDENIRPIHYLFHLLTPRRIGYVCPLLTRNGVIAIAAAISPYRAIRDEVRKMVGSFVEIYADCPLEVCIQRDVKGMYKKALAGEMKEFTGISDPYEAPLHPEVTLRTDQETPEASAARLLRRLEEMGYLPGAAVHEPYTPEEEAAIRRRLEQLGYL